MRARDLRILRSNTNHPLRLRYRTGIRRSDDDATARDTEVERQEEIRFRLQQHVAPDDATVRNAMLDVNRNVRRLNEDETILAGLVHQREAARVRGIIAQTNTSARQQRQRALLHPSFSDCYRDHYSGAILRPSTSVSASRLSTKPTAGSARPKLPVRPS